MSAVDTAQLDLMFTELRLPTFKAAWAELAERADADGWPAARLLAALAEQEIADRARRRFERQLAEAQLPPGKTLANFDFNVVPMVSKAHVNALVAGDRLLGQRVSARPRRLAVGECQLAGFGEGDEPGGAEPEFAAASADDEPLDPAAGAGRLHIVRNGQLFWQRELHNPRKSFIKRDLC